jgi:hypothetical protein
LIIADLGLLIGEGEGVGELLIADLGLPIGEGEGEWWGGGACRINPELGLTRIPMPRVRFITRDENGREPRMDADIPAFRRIFSPIRAHPRPSAVQVFGNC